MENTPNPNTPKPPRRPTFRLYHPNSKGSGGAMDMELRPAVGGAEGCIMVKLANQRTVASRNSATPTYATFDWKGGIAVKLGFMDLCKILQVMRGECECVNDGKALVHRTPNGTTLISFRHLMEPVSGYSLDVTRKTSEAEASQTAHIFITMSEACGLAMALEHSLAAICFGLPSTCEPKTEAAYAEAV